MKQIFTTLAFCLSLYTMLAFNITFRVDMSNETGFTTPEVNGTFNNWCGACAPMADANADGIWEITINLNAGNYEYKYAHDNWMNPELLAPGSSCTVTNFGFTNRSLVVTGDVVLPVVCYGACTTCDLVIPARVVTFRVDMNGVTGYTSPQLNGSFNNWCGNCAPMTDNNADGIYELTLTLPQATYEYKFTYDNWAGIEPLTPGSPCTLTTGEFTNRLLELTEDVVLDAVCWGSCTPCGVVIENHDVTFQVDMNEVTGFTTPEVNGTFNGWCGNCNPMSDTDGDGIWTVTLSIPEGSYEYKFAYDNWAGSEQLIAGSPCTISNGDFTNRTLEVTADAELDVVCWASCAACGAVVSNYDVTFQVDMSEVSGFTTPEVNGTFNDWCGNCNPLTDADGDGIWEVTLSIPEGTHEFKFAYDNWASSEQLTAGTPCTITSGEFTNRTVTISNNTVLDVVCWASCNACETVVANYDVTFQVDMNTITGFTTPEVNGTFNNWCGNCNPMSDIDGDGIWEVTLSIPEGIHEYKFTYDNWAGLEELTPGASCTITLGEFTNRTLNVTDDIILEVVCWASCNACDFVPSNYDVTFRVDMTDMTGFVAPEVNGTFNGWCGNCNAMTDVDGDGIWEVTVSIPEGTHEYKFAHDNWAGSEQLTAGSTCTITNGEFTNRTLDVTEDTELDAVCWASCAACGIVVANYDVTFRVDMNDVTGFSTPEVNGTFNGWCGNCNPMSDADGDGVWEATLSIPEGTHEFKFAYDNWAGSEQLISGLPCTVTDGTFVNRSLVVTGPTDLATVCYAACGPCGGISTFNVLFKVDMSTVAGPFTTPEVNGTFNNWCGGCAPMSDADGDNVWELTIPLQAGTYEFKYAYDNWASSESLVPGSPCTITTGAFTNRLITVSSDLDLGVVCWAECGACGSSTGPFIVTFKVNMAEYTETFTTPEVNGTFNNWCGNCAPMTDADGDNIWEISIPLAAGSHDYKFSHDNWAGQETLEPGSACTITADGFTNRVIEVSGPAVLDAVCWNSCLECIDYVIENGHNQITVFPVPANQSFTVQMNSTTQGLSKCTMYSITGQVVFESQFNGNGAQTIDTSMLVDGIYELQISNSNGSARRKLLIQH